MVPLILPALLNLLRNNVSTNNIAHCPPRTKMYILLQLQDQLLKWSTQPLFTCTYRLFIYYFFDHFREDVKNIQRRGGCIRMVQKNQKCENLFRKYLMWCSITQGLLEHFYFFSKMGSKGLSRGVNH